MWWLLLGVFALFAFGLGRLSLLWLCSWLQQSRWGCLAWEMGDCFAVMSDITRQGLKVLGNGGFGRGISETQTSFSQIAHEIWIFTCTCDSRETLIVVGRSVEKRFSIYIYIYIYLYTYIYIYLYTYIYIYLYIYILGSDKNWLILNICFEGAVLGWNKTSIDYLQTLIYLICSQSLKPKDRAVRLPPGLGFLREDVGFRDLLNQGLELLFGLLILQSILQTSVVSFKLRSMGQKLVWQLLCVGNTGQLDGFCSSFGSIRK